MYLTLMEATEKERQDIKQNMANLNAELIIDHENKVAYTINHKKGSNWRQ